MENLKCNVCSKQVEYIFQMYPLREIYQTEGIIQVCEECINIIDKQLYKLQRKCWNSEIKIKDISKEMKDYLLRLKSKKKGFNYE